MRVHSAERDVRLREPGAPVRASAARFRGGVGGAGRREGTGGGRQERWEAGHGRAGDRKLTWTWPCWPSPSSILPAQPGLSLAASSRLEPVLSPAQAFGAATVLGS